MLEIAERVARVPSDVQQFNKRSVHRQMELMGLRAGVRAGTELQALSSQTESAKAFYERARRDGLKAALDDRDRRLRRLWHPAEWLPKRSEPD